MVEVRISRGDEQDIMVEMGEDETIRDMKEKLNMEYGIPLHCQNIKWQGAPMADITPLNSLRLQESSVIVLQMDIRYVLTINMYTGLSFELEVSSNQLVQTMMFDISRRSRVSSAGQEIVYNGTIMQRDQKISDYDISDQSILVVNLRNYEATVFVKTLDGRTIVLTVHAHDTVDQVKHQIEKQEGIPVDKQRLICIGEQLRSNLRFLNHDVQSESVVHLVKREGLSFEIYIDTPSGKSYVFEVQPTDSLDKLREKVYNKERIPFDAQRIFLGNNLLSDSCSLSESGVMSLSSLRLEIEEGSARVDIETVTPGALSLWVRLNQTILSLKVSVAQREHKRVELVELYLAGTLLEDHYPLSHYRIKHADKIRANILRPIVLRFTVTVRGSSKSPLRVEQLENNTILNVKQCISKRVGATVEEQQLFKGESVLENGQTLKECGCRNDTNLDLILTQAGNAGREHGKRICLFVRTLTGKAMEVDVDPTADNVLVIKEQIHAKEGVPIAQQCLVIGGRVLEDMVLLSECGVHHQSVLHLILRVSCQDPVNVPAEREETNFLLPAMEGGHADLPPQGVE